MQPDPYMQDLLESPFIIRNFDQLDLGYKKMHQNPDALECRLRISKMKLFLACVLRIPIAITLCCDFYSSHKKLIGHAFILSISMNQPNIPVFTGTPSFFSATIRSS